MTTIHFRYRLDSFINEYRMYHPKDPKSNEFLSRAAWAMVKTIDPTARQLGIKPSNFKDTPTTLEIKVREETLKALHELARKGITYQTCNGVTRPLLAGTSFYVWNYLDKNSDSSLESLLNIAKIKHWDKFQVIKEYYRWLQFNGVLKLEKRYPSIKLELVKCAL